MAKPALVIAGVHLGYRGTPALSCIDLAVQRGEFGALLEPSGCGKTPPAGGAAAP